jgi:hypothetical protein
LRERLAKFGLELHPDKTRRIEFGKFAEENRKRRGEGKPEEGVVKNHDPYSHRQLPVRSKGKGSSRRDCFQVADQIGKRKTWQIATRIVAAVIGRATGSDQVATGQMDVTRFAKRQWGLPLPPRWRDGIRTSLQSHWEPKGRSRLTSRRC